MPSAESASVSATGEPTSHVRGWILCIILLLATVAYADRSILSMAIPGLRKEFGLSPVQIGYVLSAFSWSYVLGQIPGGLILDTFGTRHVYGVALILWSGCTFLLGFTGEFASSTAGTVIVLFGLRFALGLIEAPSFPANARCTIMWFPKSERGFATSLFASAQYFAVSIFSPLAGWLVSRFGWPWPFFVLGVLGLVCAVVWYGFMREPRRHPGVSPRELETIIAGGALVDIDSVKERRAKSRLTLAVVRALVTNRMLWCAYVGQYCIIALSYFFITWFPVYLVQGRGMNILNAGFATIAPAIFGFAGGLFGGLLSDWLIRIGWSISWARKTPYIVGMLVASLLAIAARLDSNVMVIALMSLAYFGKGTAAGAGTWAVVSDTAPREAIGLAGAIFNCVGNIAGIVTPIVFGYIVAMTGSYGVGLAFVGAHCIVAALMFLFVMGDIERVTTK